jgi:hypothetical protein
VEGFFTRDIQFAFGHGTGHPGHVKRGFYKFGCSSIFSAGNTVSPITLRRASLRTERVRFRFPQNKLLFLWIALAAMAI